MIDIGKDFAEDTQRLIDQAVIGMLGHSSGESFEPGPVIPSQKPDIVGILRLVTSSQGIRLHYQKRNGAGDADIGTNHGAARRTSFDRDTLDQTLFENKVGTTGLPSTRVLYPLGLPTLAGQTVLSCDEIHFDDHEIGIASVIQHHVSIENKVLLCVRVIV